MPFLIGTYNKSIKRVFGEVIPKSLLFVRLLNEPHVDLVMRICPPQERYVMTELYWPRTPGAPPMTALQAMEVIARHRVDYMSQRELPPVVVH